MVGFVDPQCFMDGRHLRMGEVISLLLAFAHFIDGGDLRNPGPVSTYMKEWANLHDASRDAGTEEAHPVTEAEVARLHAVYKYALKGAEAYRDGKPGK